MGKAVLHDRVNTQVDTEIEVLNWCLICRKLGHFPDNCPLPEVEEEEDHMPARGGRRGRSLCKVKHPRGRSLHPVRTRGEHERPTTLMEIWEWLLNPKVDLMEAILMAIDLLWARDGEQSETWDHRPASLTAMVCNYLAADMGMLLQFIISSGGAMPILGSRDIHARGEPHQSPATEGEPHQSPAPEGEPHQSPAPEGEPHQSPAPEGEPHQSPATEGEPHQSPTTEGEPHQSPAPEGEPHQSPAPEGEPHQSPVPEGEPHKSPVMYSMGYVARVN
ncbi:UNVERIFIED_CONTAM: hypothetical protein FKN15_009981 [Acipenser sinensis]